MNTNDNLIIIKGQIKTSEITSCRYNSGSNKWDVIFRNEKIYSYGYSNVVWLKEPKILNPNVYRIKHHGRELKNITDIRVFEDASSAYWHLCFQDCKERDYCQNDLEIEESCLSEKQAADIFEYIRQLAELSTIKNEATGEKLLVKKFRKFSFVGRDTALAFYLNPKSGKAKERECNYIPIFPFGCNSSQYKAVKDAMEHQISVIQGPPETGKTQTILNIIANILIEGKTVQVVSNNNAATENVYEKLASPKYNLGFLVAMLGSAEKKTAFIEQHPALKTW